MKIAIIGAGVSGLTAAYELAPRHDVTLFEAANYPGGHACTVVVDLPDCDALPVDVGFIVYNTVNYPRFTALLARLGVASRPTSMGFSVRHEATGLEYNARSLDGLFVQRRNLLRPTLYRLVAQVLRFGGLARKYLAEPCGEITVGEFLARERFGPTFAELYLLPIGAAIWSCPMRTFEHFPIRFVYEFFQNHGLLNLATPPVWRTVEGGSRTYVQALLKQTPARLRLSTPIAAVRRTAEAVAVQPVGRPAEPFDHVVFACHSDQALQALGAGATPLERQVLGAFPYSRNVATLHTDESRLPRSRRAWASWNFRVQSDPQAPPVITYNMNLLQRLATARTLCVTLNDRQSIADEHVLKEFVFHHPVFNVGRTAAQACHRELIGRNRTSFCGAYWGNGFHEDGVASADAVAAFLNADSPSSGAAAREQPALTGASWS